MGVFRSGGPINLARRVYWLLLAESYLTRRLCGAILGGIPGLPWPVG